MSKYFSLDKEQGAERSTTKMFINYATFAFVIISIICVIRAIDYYGSDDPVYGRRCSTDKVTYTVTGTGTTRGYDTYSLAGHCVRYLYSEGITEMGDITYEGYEGERRGAVKFKSSKVSIDTVWGIHHFKITDFGGIKGRDSVIHLIFIDGFSDATQGVTKKLYAMAETKNTVTYK